MPRNSFRAGLHLGRGEVPEPPGPPQRSVHGTDPAGRAKDHHLEVGLSTPASNVDTTLLLMGSCFLLLTGWRPEAPRAQSYPGSFSFALAHPLGGREAGRARTILESPVILEISEGRPNKGAKYRRFLTSHAENWMKTGSDSEEIKTADFWRGVTNVTVAFLHTFTPLLSLLSRPLVAEQDINAVRVWICEA